MGATNGLNKFAPRKSARYFASKPVPFFANRRTYGARSPDPHFVSAKTMIFETK